MENYNVTLDSLIKELKLEIVYMPEAAGKNGENVFISTNEVNRPGLPLAGFFDYFEHNRMQIMGKMEHTYLADFPPKARKIKLDRLFATKIPAIVVSRKLTVFPEMIESAKQYEIPVLSSLESTSNFMSSLLSILNVSLAPRVTIHAVLVEVYGEGILMMGESGVGKSETAMELLKRGHRLVADDAVEIKRVSNRTLVGSSPEIIRHLIELRGIGIVDVRRIFGMGAVKETEKIDLVIKLEAWDENKQYDRLGLENNYDEILGLEKPCITIPIKPGRNLAIIIEVAAMNNRQKRLGYNAAEELNKRLMTGMEDK